jgi:hypothetical protein
MEPLEVLIGTSLVLILSEASKEGGKSLGKAASEQLTKLKKLIASKLGRKEESLVESNPEILEGELVEAISNDSVFASQLALIIDSIKSQNELKQVILENSKAKALKVDGVIQKSGSHAQNMTQIIGSGLEIDGEISISHITQE